MAAQSALFIHRKRVITTFFPALRPRYHYIFFTLRPRYHCTSPALRPRYHCTSPALRPRYHCTSPALRPRYHCTLTERVHVQIKNHRPRKFPTKNSRPLIFCQRTRAITPCYHLNLLMSCGINLVVNVQNALFTSAVTVAGFRRVPTHAVYAAFSAHSSQDVFKMLFPAPLTTRELSVGIRHSYFFSVIALSLWLFQRTVLFLLLYPPIVTSVNRLIVNCSIYQ